MINYTNKNSSRLILLVATSFSILILGIPLTTKAQWYGQKTYNHDSTVLCSAKRTVVNPGYVMAGFRLKRQAGSGSPDFVIDKTDVNGQFTGPNDFSNEYQITPNTCHVGASGHVCHGLEVIETNNIPMNEFYALAVQDKWGVYFALLDAQGNINRQ